MQNSEPDSTEERYPIASVDNALRLLLMFREQPMVRIADAATHLDIARSTAHRMMRMLAHHGFVRQDPASRAYVPGGALIDVGLSVVSRMDLRSAAHGQLEQLAATTNETVHLARLDSPNVLFIDCVEGQGAIRVSSRVGHLMPAHTTSVGKAMLAAAADDLAGYFPGRRLPTLTSASISSRSRLEEELAVARKQGFAISTEESEVGVGSVGVAITDRVGRVLGGISIAAPVFRLRKHDLRSWADLVVAAADEISTTVG